VTDWLAGWFGLMDRTDRTDRAGLMSSYEILNQLLLFPKEKELRIHKYYYCFYCSPIKDQNW